MMAGFGVDSCPAEATSRTHGVPHGGQKKHKRKPSRRVLRVRQAFVASKTLRPMAQQLLRERTPAAYHGVEAYARLHNSEDAGSLAWYVLAYAHMIDRDPAQPLDPLRRAMTKP